LLLSVAVGVGITWISLLLAYLTDAPVSFWAPALLFALYLITGLVGRRRRRV
jgi:ABC-type Mn2+/Zn2+ transport system permease subunit